MLEVSAVKILESSFILVNAACTYSFMDEGGLGGAFLSLGVADVLVRWSTPAADAG
jgi:hypothetical protein